MAALTIPWVPFPLTPEGHPPVAYRIEHDGLVLTAAGGTDLFVDPAGAGQLPDAGRLVGMPPAGDFRLVARVSVEFASKYDAGVLVLQAGERNWAKLCFELSPQLTPMAVTVVTRGTSDDCNSFEVDSDSLWLRMTRSGAAWAFHASNDGSWWRLLRYFSLGAVLEREPMAVPREVSDVRVGFLAQSPAGQGCAVTFAQISFGSGAPSDLRDGS
jgi:uncharacterized protein